MTVLPLLVLLVACVEEDSRPIGSDRKEVSFTATTESKNDSRSNVTDDGDFTWSEGDAVAVYVDDHPDSQFVEFTLSSGANTSEGRFKGLIGEEQVISRYAVYPYNDKHALDDDNTLSIYMAEVYGDFDTEYGTNTNAPMVAVIPDELQGEEQTFEFKHVGGVIRFLIENVPTGAAQFSFTSDTGITGAFDVVERDGNAVIETKEPTGDNTEVTIKFKPIQTTRTMTFYIPLPVGTYEGFTVQIKDRNGNILDSYSTETTNSLRRKMLARYPKITLEAPSESEYVLGPQTIMYDEDMCRYIVEVGEDYFILNSSTPSDLIPSVGKIICCTITDQTPSGFLGKVTGTSADANGILVKCENVALDEAFSTLKVNTVINLSEYVEEVLDENGNKIEHEVVSSAILDSLTMNPDAADSTFVETKVGVKDYSDCLEIPIEDEALEGKIFYEYLLNVDIDISRCIIDFSLVTRTGVNGELLIASAEGNKKWETLKRTLKLKPIPAGPIVFVPQLNSQLNIYAEGEVNVKSTFQYIIENTEYKLNYNGKWYNEANDISDDSENYFKLIDLELNGGFGLAPEIGFSVGLYTSKLVKMIIKCIT